MTGQYAGTNIDLQVREIVVAAAALPDVSHVLSIAKLETVLDGDALIWFWNEIERQFDIVVTKAQRTSLPTAGHVIHYLKQRIRMDKDMRGGISRRSQEAHGR
jgi:hypothetical protein